MQLHHQIELCMLLCSPKESWHTKVLLMFELLGMQTCHQHIQQCTSVMWKSRSEEDYISVSFEAL